MPHTDDLAPAVRAMLDATNAGDSQAFLATFAHDGMITRFVISG